MYAIRTSARRSVAMRRLLAIGGVVVTCFVLATATPARAAGGRPVIERGAFVESFADDFILELCGIETITTLTQRFEVMTFPDGSAQVHVVRTFRSDDPRLPIEKGAATTFVSPDGTRTVIGTPIHLIGPRGTRLLDAGQVTFGTELAVRGPHPSLFAPSLAPYYCPS